MEGQTPIGAAYIRVSTDDQTEYSPESQLSVIRDYARQHGIMIPAEFIFQEDDGVSGRQTKKRIEFMRMMGVAKTKPKPFDVILLWRFSRFARNRQDSVVYKSMLRKDLGIDVVSVNEPLPEDDKISILIEALIEAMDEYYSINLAEDVRRGMISKAKRGEAIGIPPFGYDIRDKKFCPNPSTAPIVQMIFTEYLSGANLRELAVRLNEMGVRSRRGSKLENRTLEYILHNPVYIGKIRYSPVGHINRSYDSPNLILSNGIHEPIIQQELWEQVQAKLEQNKFLYGKYAQKSSLKPNVLQGLCKCSSCGATLSSSAGGLNCNKYVHGLCTVSHYIGINKMFQAILNGIESDFKNLQFDVINKPIPNPVDMHRIINSQIEREQRKLERVRAAYENGIDSLAEYHASKEKIAKIIAKLSKQQPVLAPAVTAQEFVNQHQEALQILRDPSVDATTKNLLLRSFINRVVFDRQKNSIDIFYCF